LGLEDKSLESTELLKRSYLKFNIIFVFDHIQNDPDFTPPFSAIFISFDFEPIIIFFLAHSHIFDESRVFFLQTVDPVLISVEVRIY
jgi:hypothetical protein